MASGYTIAGILLGVRCCPRGRDRRRAVVRGLAPAPGAARAPAPAAARALNERPGRALASVGPCCARTPSARFEQGFLRRRLVTGAREFPFISAASHRAILREQERVPVAVAEDERRTWWMFRDRFFWEDDGLERRRGRGARPRARPAAAAADRRGPSDLMAAEAAAAGPRREPIPEDVRARGLPARRRPLRGLRIGGAAPVRPRDPGRARRGLDRRRTSRCCARRATARRAPRCVSVDGAPAVA